MNINRYQDCATTIEMENQSLRPAITKKINQYGRIFNNERDEMPQPLQKQ